MSYFVWLLYTIYNVDNAWFGEVESDGKDGKYALEIDVILYCMYGKTRTLCIPVESSAML